MATLPLHSFWHHRQVLTVGELSQQIKALIEANFPAVWVMGEISNLSRPRSGHIYLTLKDAQAQLPAVIWRSVANKIRFELTDGLEVVCFGYLDVYPPHGKYQLVISQLEPRGLGALELAFRQLYERLAKEGLFDPARKRPLPRFIRRLALLTSPTGAAIHDFLQILQRRWRGVSVLVVAVRVQGEGAAEEIVEAIHTVNRLKVPFDCLVIARGGGSTEDLWTFNEEKVVRAVAASRIPVVSAVGHEIDVTLTDLAADLRALTPSEAAERLVPSAEELSLRLRQYSGRLVTAMRARLDAARARWNLLAGRTVFRRPKQWLYQLTQTLDGCSERLHRAVQQRLEKARQRWERASARLEALSPLAVLRRGYSLTQKLGKTAPVYSAAELTPGDVLYTRFAEGAAVSRVERCETPTEYPPTKSSEG